MKRRDGRPPGETAGTKRPRIDSPASFDKQTLLDRQVRAATSTPPSKADEGMVETQPRNDFERDATIRRVRNFDAQMTLAAGRFDFVSAQMYKEKAEQLRSAYNLPLLVPTSRNADFDKSRKPFLKDSGTWSPPRMRDSTGSSSGLGSSPSISEPNTTSSGTNSTSDDDKKESVTTHASSENSSSCDDQNTTSSGTKITRVRTHTNSESSSNGDFSASPSPSNSSDGGRSSDSGRSSDNGRSSDGSVGVGLLSMEPFLFSHSSEMPHEYNLHLAEAVLASLNAYRAMSEPSGATGGVEGTLGSGPGDGVEASANSSSLCTSDACRDPTVAPNEDAVAQHQIHVKVVTAMAKHLRRHAPVLSKLYDELYTSMRVQQSKAKPEETTQAVSPVSPAGPVQIYL